MIAALLTYWPILTVLGAAVLGGARWGIRIHNRVANVEKDSATKTSVAEINVALTDLKDQTNRIDSKIDKLLLRGR